ncbi:MAG: acyl-CoA synthetase, partial [Rhodospirillaceae bacterium]|nr:acyl-CoA synthetase [Rhodospirillaceae bacterium]
KDMFISGGENVYPAEVEAVIAELPDVAESAVVGVPDDRWGEVGRVYVIPVPGRTVTGDEILEHCRQRLAKFKIPKTAVVTDTLPRTASGKLQKHILKAQAMREIASD